MNKYRLKKKVAIITGACGLIGGEFTKALSSEGAKVIALDLNIKRKLKDKNIDYHQIDLKNEKSLKIFSNKILRKYKKIDCLINCAFKNPVPTNQKKIDIFNLKSFIEDLNDNFTTTLLSIKYFGSVMKKNKNGGSIINLSSDLGLISPDQRLYSHMNYFKPISYSVSKHGIIGLTKYIATLWAKNKIRCNSIAPGGIYNGQNNNFVKKVRKLIPLGRMAKKDEYNDLMIFLCSDKSSYITGSTIVADGGRTIW